MAADHLVYPTDYTIAGNRLTLTVTPTPGTLHEFSYSFIPEGGSSHAHTKEFRSDWTSGNTWVLAHVPDLGELAMFRQKQGVSLWGVHGALATLNVQVMHLNPTTGLQESLGTAITGFASAADVTALKPSRTNANLAYVGIRTATQALLYRVNNGALLLVHVINSTGLAINDIYVEYANNNSVWFTVGPSGAAIGDATLKGVYHSTDGLTFARTGSGVQGAYLHGATLAGVWGIFMQVRAAAPTRRLWDMHSETTGGLCLAYSENEGVTWTDNIDLNGTFHTIGKIQGFPAGLETSLYFNGQNNDVGLEHSVQVYQEGGPGYSTPIAKSIGFGVMGAVGSVTQDWVICPSLGINANGGKAVGGLSNANFTAQGNLWWDTIGSTMISGLHGFSMHGLKDWFVAAPIGRSYCRITIDKGATWKSLTWPGQIRAVAFVENT